jgi:hypothetical protein
MSFIAMMVNGGELEMKQTGLNQEQVDELNAIFRISKPSKKRVLVWDSALTAFQLGNYHVMPLTSSWALREEGRVMHHCVGGYDEMCAKGRVRVFSTRDPLDHRVATLSLVFRDDYWHLEQIKGFANKDVSITEDVYYDGERTVVQNDMTDLHYVAHEVLRCYRKAWEN